MLGQWITEHRLITAVIGAVIIGMIGFGTYTMLSRIGKEAVDVYIIPSDATLTANGQRIPSGTAYLTPGTYTIEATRDGFESYSTTISVLTPNTAVIDIALAPVSEEAKQWQKANEKLYYEHEGRIGDRANIKGEAFSQKNPITAKLPVDLLIYNIGYRTDPSDPSGNSIIIEIDAPAGFRNAAVKKITELGFDPTDFKINFTNYESPF
jgi:hypothetical protein